MYHRSLRSVILLTAGVLSLAICGCGPSDGRPVLARVSGTITYKSKPLGGASVVFLPAKEGIRSAMGVTDDQGRYTLWTYEPGDGAPVGNHQVTVTLRGPPEKTPLEPSLKGKGLGDAYYEQVTGTGKPLIPEKYFTAKTSGLTAVVEAGRQNVLDFPLEGEVGKKP